MSRLSTAVQQCSLQGAGFIAGMPVESVDFLPFAYALADELDGRSGLTDLSRAGVVEVLDNIVRDALRPDEPTPVDFAIRLATLFFSGIGLPSGEMVKPFPNELDVRWLRGTLARLLELEDSADFYRQWDLAFAGAAADNVLEEGKEGIGGILTTEDDFLNNVYEPLDSDVDALFDAPPVAERIKELEEKIDTLDGHVSSLDDDLEAAKNEKELLAIQLAGSQAEVQRLRAAATAVQATPQPVSAWRRFWGKTV